MVKRKQQKERICGHNLLVISLPVFVLLLGVVSLVECFASSPPQSPSSKTLRLQGSVAVSSTATDSVTWNATGLNSTLSTAIRSIVQPSRGPSSEDNHQNKDPSPPKQIDNEKEAGNMSLFVPSGLDSASSSSKAIAPRSQEPSLISKLVRRFTVFRVAFSVFIEYKLAERNAKKLKKKLNLDVDDPDSDDHPDIMKLWSEVHERNASRLLVKIKHLAGFWVKVGQYLSTRADVMPPEYLEKLSELQDSMPPKPWEDIVATIQEELGGNDDLSQRIASIDPEPLSTASLAQVHRATLKGPEKHQIVLKVQHRGVASLMIQDMVNLRVILDLLAKTDKDLDFSPVIREYNQEVRKELDFRIEAQNMDEVRRLLQDNNVQAIIPKTISNLVTERVIVMDFCEGFPVRDTHLMDKYSVDRELLLERICEAWAMQVHVGGLFNADPHGANILVSTSSETDTSIPVLLDFGLTKRLDSPIKLAFARLMHASYEGDVDALIQSFQEMGLKMNRHDPFENMAAMQRGFGNTVPKKDARAVQKQKSVDYQRRVEAQRAEAGLSKGQKLRNPVDAWPSELIFFGRMTNMLRGLCSQLDVSYPYLQTMASAAKETIKASVPLDEHADDLVHHSSHTTTTNLQKRLLDALPQIEQGGHMVGLQLCVLQNGEEIANIAAGTIGVASPRPVTTSTLFNIFSVSKGLLSIGVLRLLQDGKIESLDDPVSKYWPAFMTKPKITVRHLLTHQAGLANVYPEDATLDTLLDWKSMTTYMAEHAQASHEPGEETQYHALSYAWLVGGLIEAVTGRPYEKLFEDLLSDTAMADEIKQQLFLAGIDKDVDYESSLAVLSLDRRGSQQQRKEDSRKEKEMKKQEFTEKRIESTDDEEEDEEVRRKAKQVLAKYRGLQQLMNPSVFNMRKVREAKLPSANGHSSASSLAHVFYAAIRVNDPILSTDILSEARLPQRSHSFDSGSSLLNDAQASFGLGFQLHEFVLANGHKAMSIGHAGLGGSVVLAVPEEQVVVALTLNHLSNDSEARQQLLGIVFDELQWQAPASIPVAKLD